MQFFVFVTLLVSTLCFSASAAPTGDVEPPFTDFVFFEVEQNNEVIGTIKLGLYGSVAPRTVKNFYELATSGFEGKGYQGTIFHRVIENFMIQGGDFENHDGTGGYSIYGKKFEDETFELKHDRLGRLSMANAGPNTNGAQFFITTAITSWLDGHHVVFGQVVDGMEVVDTIQKAKKDKRDRPEQTVSIVKSWGEQNKDVSFTDAKDYEEQQITGDEVSTNRLIWIFGAFVALMILYMAAKYHKSGSKYASMRE